MRRILIVDDSPAVRRALAAQLDPYGFEVEQAENGAVAGALLKRTPFDLVFLDLHMPVLDGVSLLRLMRAQRIATKVVLVTAGAATPVVAEAVRMGATDYVAKPFDAEQIRTVLARALGLDAAALKPERPRLLLQHADPAVRADLAPHLPSHVQLEEVAGFADALERAARAPYQLVLIDAEGVGGDVAGAAGRVRALLPTAGIFALSPQAEGRPAWAPDGPLDGVLGRALDEPLVHGFLYANFLRPLVFVEGDTLIASGCARGTVPAAYFRQLGRVLAARAATLADQPHDLTVDLTRAPRDVPELAQLIRIVRGRIDEVGGAATFVLPAEVAARVTARPEAARAVIVAAEAAPTAGRT